MLFCHSGGYFKERRGGDRIRSRYGVGRETFLNGVGCIVSNLLLVLYYEELVHMIPLYVNGNKEVVWPMRVWNEIHNSKFSLESSQQGLSVCTPGIR